LTILNADQILVLEQGRAIERGRPTTSFWRGADFRMLAHWQAPAA